MDSLTYYQTLTKKELKERLTIAIMKLDDLRYRAYLNNAVPVDEFVYVNDVDAIRAALAAPRKRGKKEKVAEAMKPLEYYLIVNGTAMYPAQDIIQSMVDDYEAMGFDVKLESVGY